MHLDLAHALVAGVLILLTLWVLRMLELRRDDLKWDWHVFIAIFVVMALLNIVWPYSSP